MEQIKKYWLYAVLFLAVGYIAQDQFFSWEAKRFEAQQNEMLKANGFEKVSCESIQPVGIAAVDSLIEPIQKVSIKKPLRKPKKAKAKSIKKTEIDTATTKEDYLNQRRFDAKGREIFYNRKTKTWI